jgi:transglutaminase-like putative cysteine protease
MRKSLSASLGSWYIHLIYNPRGAGLTSARTSGRESLAMLYFPPYLALTIGIGAGCQALAHFITLGNLTAYLLAALLTAIFISYGARCGPGIWKRFCGAMRWPFVGLILFLALSARTNSLLPPESEGEGNSIVAVLVGLTTIISVAVVGARSGGRTVPLSAPLVPGLSLFGLLCLVSVDTIVQVCFLFFVASALYLLAYERFLRRYIAEDQPVPKSRRRRAEEEQGPVMLRPLPSVSSITHWAAGSLLVCSVWFGLFMLGGALFYYPVQAVLPRLLAPQLSRVRAAAQGSLLDFRGSSSVMELRGGTYVLSDREMLHITVQQGEATGLWRGRVYDRYERSRWEEGDSPSLNSLEPRFSIWPRSPITQNRKLTPPDPAMGHVEQVIEYVEPADGTATAVYSSGVPVSVSERQDSSDDNGYDPLHGRAPYMVRSEVLVPKSSKLVSAPGLQPKAVERLSPGAPQQVALQLPADEFTRRTISAVAQQVRLGSRMRLDTPYAKVRAISDYLIQNCEYSLHAPAVPSTQDAVVFFLTQSHAGACDMFASSMVLMLREMGVPARVVTGYIQPEATPQNLRGTRERPTWIVRERDAHAWVEYYVPKMGWLSYDPTAGTRQANESIPSQIAELLALPTISLPPRVMFLPAAGIALILVGLLWTMYDRRAGQRMVRTPDEMDRRRIATAYMRAVGSLHRRVPREPHWTPKEYEERVSRANLSLAAKQEFAALTYLYTSAYYEVIPPRLRAAELEACLRRFQHGLRHRD